MTTEEKAEMYDYIQQNNLQVTAPTGYLRLEWEVWNSLTYGKGQTLVEALREARSREPFNVMEERARFLGKKGIGG